MVRETAGARSFPGIVVTPRRVVGPPVWFAQGISQEAVRRRILLVGSRTMPGVLNLLVACAGLVCQSHALTSHVVILARESSTPCIVGVDSLAELGDAAEVELDPATGLVVARWTHTPQ